MDNHLVLAGTVRRGPETKRSPAGIPITRFILQHRSQQDIAGYTREVYCGIQVVASGEALQEQVKQLTVGSEVKVSGVLSRASHLPGEQRLVLHAECIEPLTRVADTLGDTGRA